MKLLHIAPNRPLFVSLVDPNGEWDDENARGIYETITGHTFHLPRPAVVMLNLVGPKPGEEIEITQIWDGRHGSPREWSIRLSNRSEKARAEQEASQDAPADSHPPVNTPRPIEAPTPIRKAKREEQPRLFDVRGTGTDGPALMPAGRAYAAPQVALRKVNRPTVEPIPANVAFREVSAWVARELRTNDMQWSDKCQQAMVSTVFIAEYRQGRIGPWEREK